MFGAEDESLSQFFHLAASEAKCGEAGPLTAHCSLAPLPCPARVLWRLLALAVWASLAWRFQFFRLAGEV